MPIFGGPVDTLLIAGMLAVAVAAWVLRPRRYPGPRSMTGDEIDREVLEAAEREVRDLNRSREPGDDSEDDGDWGPGTARRPQLR